MKQILCFGDSNTWGLIPNTMEKYAWGVRWTSILQDKLENKNVRVIEDGLCGRTTVFDDVLRPYRNGSKQLPLSLEVHSDIDMVILMLGTNDCKTHYQASAAVIGKGIERLLRQIREKHQDAKILLLSPIELGEDVWKENFDPEFDVHAIQKSRDLKRVYQTIAKKWDIEFLAASDYAAPSDEDREHMTAEGHKSLAEAICKKVTKVLFEDERNYLTIAS